MNFELMSNEKKAIDVVETLINDYWKENFEDVVKIGISLFKDNNLQFNESQILNIFNILKTRLILENSKINTPLAETMISELNFILSTTLVSYRIPEN
jgi:hypothetical protein